MPRIELTRRRFIAISAAAAAPLAWAPAGLASEGRAIKGRPVPALHEWRGVALGAQASIRLAHPDAAAARALLQDCVAEIARLERIFSLYQPDSALSRLNAAGTLDGPPLDLVALLDRAAAVSDATDGAFDVTVQPLWRRYAEHFAQPGADPAGPVLDDVLPLIDWRGVAVAAGRITLARPGMALTLNGIAQGYATDKVAALLRAAGMAQVLVDLGETRALGHHPDGRPWRVGIADPADPGRIAARLDLADAALATSGGYGTRFDPAGRFNHLIDPQSGRSAPALRSVSVLARDATTADAASTALALVGPERIGPLLARLGGLEAHLVGPEGVRIVRGA